MMDMIISKGNFKGSQTTGKNHKNKWDLQYIFKS